MTPFRDLIAPPDGEKDLARWYLQTGGLRGRLQVLAGAADALAGLHARGLAHGGPSPDNILFALNAHGAQVQLREDEPFRPTSRPGEPGPATKYTAPELAGGRGAANSLTDAFALAVMAFEALTLRHPLEQGTGARGTLPEQVFGELLESLQSMFGAGLDEPAARPGMATLARRLTGAADDTLLCSCSATFRRHERRCPWCNGLRSDHALAAVMVWDPGRVKHCGGGVLEDDPGLLGDPGGNPRVVHAVAIAPDETRDLPGRLMGMETPDQGPLLSVHFKGKQVQVKAARGQRIRLATPGGEPRRWLDHKPVSLFVSEQGSALYLHASPPVMLHRVLRFDLIAGGEA